MKETNGGEKQKEETILCFFTRKEALFLLVWIAMDQEPNLWSL
jgi:hypothetical protein